MQIKQPFETTMLGVPFGVPLGTIEAVAVVARGLVPEIAALVVEASTIAGNGVQVEVSGGTDGERYLVTVRATSAGGSLQERETEIAVVDFSWAVPTIASPYLTAQAFVDRAGLDLVIRITDDAGTGRINVPRLAAPLADAQAEADGYLAGLYAVPLAVAPDLVVTIVYDLALLRLWQSSPAEAPAGVIDAAKNARRQLVDISKRVIILQGSAGLIPTDIAPEPVLFQTTDRVFTRAKLTGF